MEAVAVAVPGELCVDRLDGALSAGAAACGFRDVVGGATATHRRLREHVVTIIVATVGVDLLCAVAAFLLERHAQQTEVKTFGSAALWTTTQLLTGHSQITKLISLGGRILDVFIEIYASTVIATLAGAIVSSMKALTSWDFTSVDTAAGR
jgi:hypothetical protein